MHHVRQHDRQHLAHGWVDAAPFAAHLRHVAATSGVPWAVVAGHAGVPVGLAARLVARHHPARLPRSAAHRLFSVSADTVAGLRSAWVASEPTRLRLAEIERRAHDPLALAEAVGIPARLIEAARGEAAGVRLMTAVAVQVLLELSDRLSTGRADALVAVA